MTALDMLAGAAAHPAMIDPAAQTPSQSVVIQPAPPTATSPAALNLDVSYIGAWAVAIAAIAVVVGLVYKAMTRELKRDIADVQTKVGDVEHRMRGQVTRIDALEHLRVGDIERLVRVEVAVAGIEKTAGRIEDTLNKQFGELAVSIREIRSVTPR